MAHTIRTPDQLADQADDTVIRDADGCVFALVTGQWEGRAHGAPRLPAAVLYRPGHITVTVAPGPGYAPAHLRDSMGDATPAGMHRVEESVAVYLVLDPDRWAWTIDRTTLDGYGLFSTIDDPHHEGCGFPPNGPAAAHDDDPCIAWSRQHHRQLPELPDGPDLAAMLTRAVVANDGAGQ